MSNFLSTSPLVSFDAVIDEGPHQDHGYISLIRKSDGAVAQVDDNSGQFVWLPAGTIPGAWERFVDAGNCYVAERKVGIRGFLKSGKF